MIRQPVSGLTLAILSLSFVLGACIPSDEQSEPESAVDRLVAVDSATVPHRTPVASKDPFSGFGLGDTVAVATEPQEVLLRLRNDSSEDVLVFADGGAGEVQVDSIGAGGWTRVELVTRAPTVILRSTDLHGRLLRRVEITVGTDTVREVSVSAP